MRKYVLCVPPAFVGGIRCASFSFWLVWGGCCLSVCLSSSSFLPSFQVPFKFLNIIPLPSSSAFFVRAMRHQIGIESSCEKAMKPALLCLLLLNPDDSPF
jgi:hypothetical protein